MENKKGEGRITQLMKGSMCGSPYPYIPRGTPLILMVPGVLLLTQ